MKQQIKYIDCMAYMATLGDNAFQLAIVDPPYGIGGDGKKNHSRGSKWVPATKYIEKKWDNAIPSKEYFEELFRVSKNQIIWGGNYFIEHLRNTSCMIVWDKRTSGGFADCELAWTSFKIAVRKFDFAWCGYRQGDMRNKEKRIHPTQKPVALYKWLLRKYAKPGDRILDTHLGSGSSAIAAENYDFEFVGCEKDIDYYNMAKERFFNETKQLRLF